MHANGGRTIARTSQWNRRLSVYLSSCQRNDKHGREIEVNEHEIQEYFSLNVVVSLTTTTNSNKTQR